MTAVAAPSRAPATVPADPFAFVPRAAVIAVAMSGGVDSSVAAARCAASGRRTIGITLAMWARDRERDRDRGCCSIDAVEDARRVAATLGIPHYTWDLEAEFTDSVIAAYVDEHLAGRTPNPCIRCNQRVKFGALLDHALQAGATHVATGHYARTGRRAASVTLHRAAARAKDQSYTLYRLSQRQLTRAVLPLGGEADKTAVRAAAAALGLVTAAKPDSQELCFVEGSARADLERRLDGRLRRGPIVDEEGRELGEHRGAPLYTVGQRTGLGVAPRRSDAIPLHVIAIDVAANTVRVGPRASLATTALHLEDTAWVDAAPTVGARVDAQLRSHGAPVAVTVEAVDGPVLELRCAQATDRVAPGQSVVLYDGDEVLGGGVVAR